MKEVPAITQSHAENLNQNFTQICYLNIKSIFYVNFLDSVNQRYNENQNNSSQNLTQTCNFYVKFILYIFLDSANQSHAENRKLAQNFDSIFFEISFSDIFDEEIFNSSENMTPEEMIDKPC